MKPHVKIQLILIGLAAVIAGFWSSWLAILLLILFLILVMINYNYRRDS